MECPKCKGKIQVKEHTETDIQYACLNDKCEMYGIVVYSEPLEVIE